MEAHRVLHVYSTTAPSEALAKAVAFVVKDAKDHTYFTTTSKIDTELQVQTTPVIATRGRNAGQPLRSGRKNYAVTEGGLATKIVLARLNPYSNYNILTDRRYWLPRFGFSPGQGVAGFWKKVEQVAQRMVAARHSSIKFFLQSWNAVIGALAAIVPANYTDYFNRVAGKTNPALGAASSTGMSTNNVTITIENRLGMDSRYPTINAIRNMSAHQQLVPVLQAAIDRNFEKQMQLIAKKKLLDLSPQLKALGLNVQ